MLPFPPPLPPFTHLSLPPFLFLFPPSPLAPLLLLIIYPCLERKLGECLEVKFPEMLACPRTFTEALNFRQEISQPIILTATGHVN